jgi:hypothetical protein
MTVESGHSLMRTTTHCGRLDAPVLWLTERTGQTKARTVVPRPDTPAPRLDAIVPASGHGPERFPSVTFATWHVRSHSTWHPQHPVSALDHLLLNARHQNWPDASGHPRTASGHEKQSFHFPKSATQTSPPLQMCQHQQVFTTLCTCVSIFTIIFSKELAPH